MNNINEVKPSFTIKYILLIIIICAITTVITFYIQDYLGKEKNTLTVSQILSNNKLSSKLNVNDPIEIKYILRDEPGTEIKSYYLSTIFLENSSNRSIEDFDLVISSNNPSIHFIKDPVVNTIPREISKGITIQREESLSNKHRWKIDLLNKQETLIFEYSMYSKEYIEDLNIDIVPRKKDWDVIYKNISPTDSSKSLLFGLLINVLIIIVITLLAFPIIIRRYKTKWDLNEELRKKYNNKFWKYFLTN